MPGTAHSSIVRLCAVALGFALVAPARADAPDPTAFAKYLADLWPLAQSKRVSRKTFDAATAGLRYDPKIAAHTEAQAEFSLPIWTYLAGAVIAPRIAAGAAQYRAMHEVLDKAYRTYGVDAGAILGCWAVETEFGAFSGGENVLNALATLGFIHYQGDLGRDELIAALQILEAGDVQPGAMRGSWAGAMGQPQFMPSSYLAYAVDFDGHGKRDIWTDKADAIGSIAHFLKEKGWTKDLPWAFEVTLPANYSFDASDFSGEAPFAAFEKKGAKPISGAWPKEGMGRLYFPAGARGPALIVTHNFDVIKTYNNSNAYVMAVGLLGDAIVGRARLKAAWPAGERALNKAELKSVQTALKTRGFQIGEIDGRAGPKLEQAVRAYQFMEGLTPDGYANPALLGKLAQP